MSDNNELTPEQKKIKKFLWLITIGLLIWGGISLWQNDKTFLSIFVFFITIGIAGNIIKEE
jgi:hypothetical protein